MKKERGQRLRKTFKVISAISAFISILCSVIGISLLTYLHWDTFLYGIVFMLFGWLLWYQSKMWFLFEQLSKRTIKKND